MFFKLKCNFKYIIYLWNLNSLFKKNLNVCVLKHIFGIYVCVYYVLNVCVLCFLIVCVFLKNFDFSQIIKPTWKVTSEKAQRQHVTKCVASQIASSHRISSVSPVPFIFTGTRSPTPCLSRRNHPFLRLAPSPYLTQSSR